MLLLYNTNGMDAMKMKSFKVLSDNFNKKLILVTNSYDLHLSRSAQKDPTCISVTFKTKVEHGGIFYPPFVNSKRKHLLHLLYADFFAN